MTADPASLTTPLPAKPEVAETPLEALASICTVIALLLLAIGVKGLQLMGNQLWVTDLFNGLALLVAVSAAVLGAKRIPKRKRKAAQRESAAV